MSKSASAAPGDAAVSPLFPVPAPTGEAPAPTAARRRRGPSPAVRPLADAGRAALALEAHERLCGAYHCPIAYFHALPPLDELVSSLLSHRTRNADSARAFRSLRERFPSWEAVERCVGLMVLAGQHK